MDQDKYKVLYKNYKAAAEASERSLKIMDKQKSRVMRILTAERSARLFWLYRLGKLHVRILEDAQQDISEIIDESALRNMSSGRKPAMKEGSQEKARIPKAMEATESTLN